MRKTMKRKEEQSRKEPKKRKPGGRRDAEGKEKREQKKTVPGEWLYFLPEEHTARGLYEALADGFAEELWEEAGVLEIQIGGGGVMDLEAAQIHPKDEITRLYAEKNGCTQVFLVTFVPEDYEKAEKVMQKLIAAAGGFFCGDTEDFTPIVGAAKGMTPDAD